MAAFTAALAQSAQSAHLVQAPPPRGRTSSPKPMPSRQAGDDNTRSLPVPIACSGRGRDDAFYSGIPSPNNSTPSYFFDAGSTASSYRVGLPTQSGNSSPKPCFRLGDRGSRVSSVDRQSRVRDHQRQVAQFGADLDNPPMSPLTLPLPEGGSPRFEPWALGSPLAAGGVRRSLDLNPSGGRRPLGRSVAAQEVRGFDPAPSLEAPGSLRPGATQMQRSLSSYGAGDGTYEIFRFEQDGKP